jgi:hypothetical protein
VAKEQVACCAHGAAIEIYLDVAPDDFIQVIEKLGGKCTPSVTVGGHVENGGDM